MVQVLLLIVRPGRKIVPAPNEQNPEMLWQAMGYRTAGEVGGIQRNWVWLDAKEFDKMPK